MITEGAKLSGKRDCRRMTLWRIPHFAGAEGAKSERTNLSGKRTEPVLVLLISVGQFAWSFAFGGLLFLFKGWILWLTLQKSLPM